MTYDATKFERYMHIERLGSDEVDGILDGICYVFPKIDGTNASVWFDSFRGVYSGSRNRELSEEKDNAGFHTFVESNNNIKNFGLHNPTLRLYGEFLVPHTLKTYRDDAWNRFYVFDVMDSDGNFIPYETYQPLLEEFGLDYLAPLYKVRNPDEQLIMDQMRRNTHLIKDGCGVGEGVVVKNYDFKNKYGRVVWAKMVTTELKEKNTKVFGVAEVKCDFVEQQIVDEFLTQALVDKVYAKIVLESPWSNKHIPQLLNTVFHDFVVEEMWDIVKKHKNPVIDFSRLQRFAFSKIKELRKDLF